MTPAGWIFFGLSWAFLIVLNLSCFRKVLSNRTKH